jgi:hypothetical protein
MGVQAQGKKEMKSLLTRPSSLEMLKRPEKHCHDLFHSINFHSINQFLEPVSRAVEKTV